MHQLIAAFFAMIFSFSHGSAMRHNDLASMSNNHPFIQVPAPTREELAREQFETTTSYAEMSCVSCRGMNVVYDAR
ncbi:MAG TPA: hypothetical protein VGM11_03665 [Acidobacteriaceae bacterium]|jgi:hypothetical protein